MRLRRLAVLATCVAFLACVTPATVALGTPPELSKAAPSPETDPLSAPFAPGSARSPEEAEAIVQSRTRFAGLSNAAALTLAHQTFALGRPAWAPPGREQGASISKYIDEDHAIEKLPNGKHALVASTIPLQVGGAPTSLTLHANGNGYVPANPVVPISISNDLAQGIAFESSGITVRPSASSSAEAPAQVGDSIFFANSAKDADTILEPVPAGAEVSWQLRSQSSPQDNSLTFALPSGASLRTSSTMPGGVEVVREGQALMVIPPALARDAEGRSLPTSYTISGDTLTTHVDLSGEVDFPVLVDPLIVGYYGTFNGSGLWSNWTPHDNCGCFEAIAAYNLIQIGANPGPPAGDTGWWDISAPGAGQPGGAGITRVDLSGVEHQTANQSWIIGEIANSNGSQGFTFNGFAGLEKGRLESLQSYSNQSIAFCAQGGGGHDGGEYPLCNEEYSGQEFLIEDGLATSSRTVFNYVRVGGAQITYLDATSPNLVEWVNPSGSSKWQSYGPTNDYINASDQGVGIWRYELQLPPGHSPTFHEESSCKSSNGFTGCPQSGRSANIDLSPLNTGEYEVGAVVTDAAENANLEGGGGPYPKLFIDHTPPSTPALSGALAEAAGTTIGNGNYPLHFSSEDGSPTAPQSGVKSIEVKVDGRPAYTMSTSCAEPTGKPTEGCYGLSGEWTLNGQSIGAGTHTISVTATDWVGNKSSPQALTVTVNEAANEQVGPGAVNLETGDYKLSATDVSVAAGAATLSVSRTFDSRNPQQGAGGPLGPSWLLNLPAGANSSWQSLTPLAEGRISLTAITGEQMIFSPKSGGGWESPAGFQTDILSEPSSGVYQLTEASGNYTQFTKAGTETAFYPSAVAEAGKTGGLNKVAYSFTKTSGGIVEPTKILGPEPSEGACTTTLVKGCRALLFHYATSTSASGEASNQWGSFEGRLSQVDLYAWDPSRGEMREVPEAEYAYDNHGRLRAEWDPQVEKSTDCGESCAALKTIYGYDSEERVTALTPPGQETWAFSYGTAGGDTNPGRALKVTQSPASAPLWGGSLPSREEAPKLTGSSYVGVTLGVTSGKWSHSPVAYDYQWEDCSRAETECTPIPGATNANYTIANSDLAHVIKVTVSAINGGGSSSTVISTDTVVAPREAYEYSLPTGSAPRSITTGPDGNLWFTDEATSKIGKITTAGKVTEYALPKESAPTGIVAGPDGKLWFTDRKSSKIGKITTSGTITEYSLAANSGPLNIVAGPDGNLWFTAQIGKFIGKITTSGTITQYSASGLPTGIAVGPDGNLWITELGTKIVRMTTSGSATEYSLAAESKPTSAITVGPDGNLWVSAGSKKLAKVTTAGAITEYTLPEGKPLNQIVTGPDGNLWFTRGATTCAGESEGESKVSRITTSGTLTEYENPWKVTGITTGPDSKAWLPACSTSKIVQWNTNPTQGEAQSAGPGSTIEYGVPLSGSGLPNLSTSQIAKWGQTTDTPEEATAIFPPDEHQGWPASDYRRATIYYLDSHRRTVNVATPGGGVTTSEYDAHNNVTRSLSADDRQRALESASPETTAQSLDTKNTYSADGTQLESTLGPEHTIKLQSGSEVQARKITRYRYDEGAPGGGPYHLVTKTTEAALVGGEEQEVRTVTSSYSGQEGLGWKLHAPTSSTEDPSGLALVHKLKYDEATGNVLEDSAPAASSEMVYPPAYASTFASGEGSGNGQLHNPGEMALDASGNVWVADTRNNRIEEFSSSGTFLHAYGKEGSGTGPELQLHHPYGIAFNPSNGYLYVADSENNRVVQVSTSGNVVGVFGTSGEGALREPVGLAIGSAGEVFVTDWEHNQIVVFSNQGTFIRKFGSYGSGKGQLSGPSGIVLSEGSVYVVDAGNSRIEQFSTTGEYLGQFGSKGSGNGQFEHPSWITANPSSGNLYVSDTFNYRIQEFSPAGRFLTQWGTWGPKHGLSYPSGLAIGSTGKLLVADLEGDQVTTWNPPEAGAARLTYGSSIGSHGSGGGQFSVPIDAAIDGEGDVWVTDWGNGRIEKFSSKGSFIEAIGSYGSGERQFNAPGGIDVNQSAKDIYVSDAGNARIEELTTSGSYVRSFGTSGECKLTRPGGLAIDSAGNVWVPDMTADKVIEFSSSGACLHAYGKEGSGELQFKYPVSIAVSGENLAIADAANHRVQEITKAGAYVRSFAIEGGGSGELYDPEGIASDAAGNLYVVDDAEGHVEEFSPSGGYMATFATKGGGEGQLTNPVGDVVDAAGDLYVVDTEDNRVEKWNAVDQAAHTTQTIYYTTGENSEYKGCGGHAEWAGLPCLAKPAQQPHQRGLENLPETTYTYNIWQEPVTTTDTVGSKTRTTTIEYDGAGRVASTAISSSINTALPSVSDTYSKTTGARIEESAGGKAIKQKFNTLGELVSYIDADGTESTFEYDIDHRIEKEFDGKGTDSYKYDETTGLPTSKTDSAAGTFTASYDAEYQLTSEGYPNGMSAKFTRDAVGEPTGLEYVKTTHCSSECTWYSDNEVPSINGQALSQTSSLAKESYAYDGAGRLTETQETPTGQGCTVRLYKLDEDGNRTSLTTRAPGAEGKCASEGGTAEQHLFDEGDRLVDEGVGYEPFGNTTSLPANDAGGHSLTSTFYVNDALASQTQNGQSISYSLDPARRTRETVSTGTTNSTVISHYSGEGDVPSWTVDGSGIWTRYVQGIGTGLAAIQTNGGTPVLQLVNLHGDIVATAAMSETETKLLSQTETSEFGVPSGSNPEKYAYLGSDQRATELPSGVIAMGARTYVPQLGRFEQSDPQPGGSIDAYAYTTDDPVNAADPSGAFTTTSGYDYEAAESGAAREGLSENFIEPGAIMPAPVNMQLQEEWNARPPRGAITVEESAREVAEIAGQITVYEGSGGGNNATAAHAAECWEGAFHIMHCHSSGVVQGGSQCLVSFAGHISTCQEVLARARAEYARQDDTTGKVKEFISALKEAIKYAKPPPP